jgi:hypothetical protein
MNMDTVAPTSRAAYQHHVSSGNKQRQRQLILVAVKVALEWGFLFGLKGSDGLTRRQIAEFADIELGATAGRVNLLIKDGLLVDKGATKCSTTGRMVGLVGLPEKQGEMYD